MIATYCYAVWSNGRNTFFPPKLSLWILFPILLYACSPPPSIDRELFHHVDFVAEDLLGLVDTVQVNEGLSALPRAQQVDSLLIMADQLKGYDAAIAEYYAEKAYEYATEENWELHRAISLYYISLMKRRLQIWGGGIEDALVDAEMSGQFFERLGRKDWLVRVNDLKGVIHLAQYERNRPMKLDTARAYFQKAQSILEAIDIPREDSITLMAEILHDLGASHFIKDKQQAQQYYEAALKGYELVNNQTGIYRAKNDLAEVYMEKGDLGLADSLLQECLQYGLEKNDKEILADTYIHLSSIRLIQFKKSGDQKLFQETISLLDKRLALNKGDEYYTYQRIGYAYNGNAVYQYRKSKRVSHPDSVRYYYDLAYQYVDSTVKNYKISIEGARSKGVLTLMDNLVYNIFNNCIDKQLEGKGDCKELLGKNTAAYLRESYKIVADLMTVNLVQANQKLRDKEKAEGDRLASQKRRELMYIGLGLLLVAGLVFLLFLQRAEQKKLRAKMEALRAQINPHFLSNSLNAIENLVNMGKNDAAAKYLVHFSRLSRKVLNGSRNLWVSLQEEIETLGHFLKLEQLRFRDKLDYHIEVEEALPLQEVEVPPMILQPYMENAIWHGIKPKSGPGKISISIHRKGKHLVYSLEDNGIGRENRGNYGNNLSSNTAPMALKSQKNG